jgi:hypothetical protein
MNEFAFSDEDWNTISRAIRNAGGKQDTGEADRKLIEKATYWCCSTPLQSFDLTKVDKAEAEAIRAVAQAAADLDKAIGALPVGSAFFPIVFNGAPENSLWRLRDDLDSMGIVAGLVPRRGKGRPPALREREWCYSVAEALERHSAISMIDDKRNINPQVSKVAIVILQHVPRPLRRVGAENGKRFFMDHLRKALQKSA